jgi:hypothetical protein
MSVLQIFSSMAERSINKAELLLAAKEFRDTVVLLPPLGEKLCKDYPDPADYARIAAQINFRISAAYQRLLDVTANLPCEDPAPKSEHTTGGNVRLLNSDPLLLHMPLPYNNAAPSSLRAYAYRCELRELMSVHRCELRPAPGEHTAGFLFVQKKRPVTDHDNFYIKPIIDTIGSVLGIEDDGLSLGYVMFSTDLQELRSGLYLAVLDGSSALSKQSLQTLFLDAEKAIKSQT